MGNDLDLDIVLGVGFWSFSVYLGIEICFLVCEVRVYVDEW